jgi:hypothetical protein
MQLQNPKWQLSQTDKHRRSAYCAAPEIQKTMTKFQSRRFGTTIVNPTA